MKLKIRKKKYDLRTWRVGDRIKYRALKTGRWRIGKITNKLEQGRWELDTGRIAYENDLDYQRITNN